MSWNRSKMKSIMPAALTVALIVVWVIGFQRPHSARLAELKEERAALNIKQGELQSKIGIARDLVGDLDKAQSHWRELTRGLVVPDSCDKLVQTLKQVASVHGIALLQSELDFSPVLRKIAEQAAINPIERIDMTLTGRGEFLSIARFLAALDQQVMVASVGDLRMSYRSAADPEIYFDIDIEAFVLMTEGGSS